jgi:MFS transporter, DHA2 family, multidrug resistance protein
MFGRSGTFYPLTLSLVLRNLPMRFVLVWIGMYATNIIFTIDMAQAWESFFIEYLSWRWIFWNGTILIPIMIALVHFGLPGNRLQNRSRGIPLRIGGASFMRASGLNLWRNRVKRI